MSEHTLSLINNNDVRWVDLRFTDTKGKEQHVSIPASAVDEDFFEGGKMFDGSSISGWKGIIESDMILMPDDSTAILDPFTDDPTVILRCDIVEPATMQGYDRDPRSIAKKAEAYLTSTGLGDTAFFGPEPEFFVFEDVKWHADMSGASYEINAEEAAWSSNLDFEDGNTGHRPGVKGGYFPVPPVDSLHDIRAAMCAAMEQMGLDVEVHHHEVGTAGQCEIGIKFNTLVSKADEVQILKYCVLNVAHAYGKTATFMPKPLFGDNGSGMHTHQSLWNDGKPLFYDEKGYGGLSDIARWYIGGILKHAPALLAFTNPSLNSYHRLVKGFEAPVNLVYSAGNRSAAIRIPITGTNPKAKRIEFRAPDASGNPYLAFAAQMMAGLDGIMNKIEPHEPVDKDLYELPAEEAKAIPQVPGSLEEALVALENDHDFLLAGGVFTEDLIETWIEFKRENEIMPMAQRPHPFEFELYYGV